MLYPGNQAFYTGMGFHVPCPARAVVTLGAVVVNFQAVLLFQLGAQFCQGFIILEGIMDRMFNGMDFVDGNMDMQVFGIAVDGTDTLVVFEAKASA